MTPRYFEIELTKDEMVRAAKWGVERYVASRFGGQTFADGLDKDAPAWNTDTEGACGEAAYAKFRDRFWLGGPNTPHTDGDVGRVQVRTATKHHYSLIVRERDPDDSYFVLLTGMAPKYRVVGWILARDAKRKEWWTNKGTDRPAAYFVPQHALHECVRKQRRAHVQPGEQHVMGLG